MDETYIETSFGKVFGMAAGEPAAPLILGLHGWSQRNGWHTWEPLMDPLSAAGFRVLSVDMPGWGRSKAISAEPLIGERAAAAALEILDGVQAETAVLMGKSWGGGIALSLALYRPDRVTRLILSAPAYREIDVLSALTQPVLLAWAEDDPVIPYSFASLFLAAIPNVRLETYPTGGHSAAPKNAEDFAPKAIRFLKGEN